MESSMKLENIEKHLIDILTLIDSNQNIKRYLKYLSDSPLEITQSQPDIEESLINENIILTPFNENILEESKVFLFFNPFQGNLSSFSVGKEIYTIDIVTHLNKWLLSGEGKIRTFRIGSEISKMIDSKDVTGVGKVTLDNFKVFKNDKYAGLTLWIKVNSSSSKSINR